ncbi:hypothetical protein EPUL_006021, partial [Erysiphe pulchra]
FEVYLSTVVGNNERPPANTKYTNDEWYGEIYNFLLFARHTSTQDRLKQLSLQRKASEYRLIEGDLFRVMRGVMKRCVVRSEVASVLEAAHDLEGHWKLRLTLKKLNNVFWPNMTKDTADFIAGCLKCGKHGNAQRTQTASPIIVTDPNELWGVDFVGPFPETILTREEAFRCSWPQLYDHLVQSENSQYQDLNGSLPEGTLRFTHCLVVVDYFSRFVWIFPVIRANCAEVVRCLSWLFGIRGCPVGLYTDPGKHFVGRELQDFLTSRNVLWIPSPTAAHKATGMVEKCIHIMEMHLGFSPFEIDGGYQPPSVVETVVPSARRTAKKKAMKHSNYLIALAKEREEQENAVFGFIAKRERCWDQVRNASSWAKQVSKDRHDMGIRKELNFTDGTMVMLYDGKSAKKQLHPSYRGPFIISGKGGSHGKSYTLKQINGTPIPGTFYGDHLKPFVPRTGHLITSNEEELSLHQNIRAKKGFHKLPQRL